MAKRHNVFGFLLAAVAVLGFSGAAWAGDAPAPDDPSWTLCREAAARVEAEFGVPDHLLAAVTLTETGRRGPDRHMSSWPWTVHDGTRGYFLKSKEEAVEFVRQLREGGRRSVDVGCMQVNLRHHPRAFTSIEDGFDPELNIRYAATFLSRLEAKHGSWEQAVARYHSYNPEFYERYADKVLGYWSQEKAMAAKATAKPVLQAAADGSAAFPRKAPGRGGAGAIVLAEADLATAGAMGTALIRPGLAPTADTASGDAAQGNEDAEETADLSEFFARSFGWPE